MTAEEAIQRYKEKFGGWPSFLFMGAEDNVIIEAVKEALRSGKEIEPPDDDEDVLY